MKRGGERRFRLVPGGAALAAGLALALLTLSAPVWAIDHYQLGKVIEVIPPNGPFWSYGNVVMRQKSKGAGMDPVVFPHWVHRARFTCRVCHLELEFSMRQGYTGIDRTGCISGSFCGACHNGKTAFGVQAVKKEDRQCRRCHLPDPEELRPAFEAFAAGLPPAPFGNGIDWAEALRQGLITPQSSLQETVAKRELPGPLKGSLRLETTSSRSDVSFSHEEHLAELDCSMCHPEIFKIKRLGTETFSMEYNLFGLFCGSCHMQVAFPMNACRKCHPTMQNVKDRP